MAQLIFPSGASFIVRPADPWQKCFSLLELQTLVAGGGYIEIMQLPDGRALIFDEEAKLKEGAYNPLATTVVVDCADIDSFGAPGSWSKDLNRLRDFIVGPALLISDNELEIKDDE